MLANRADTYNLGDVVGVHADAFCASYLENAAASNTTLARMVTRNPKDLMTLIALAENGPSEKLSFEYRTEPAFKLQGSYRNMNRLAEKIVPVMTEGEIEELLSAYYRNESQTLTTGAEANLLKFKELIGKLTPAESARWEEIKKTFRKNQVLGGTGEDDPVSRVVAKLAAFYDGLAEIKDVLAGALHQRRNGDRPVIIVSPPEARPESNGRDGKPALPSDWTREVAITQETLQKIWDLIEADRPRSNSEASGNGASKD
jgi:hypothetical protein